MMLLGGLLEGGREEGVGDGRWVVVFLSARSCAGTNCLYDRRLVRNWIKIVSFEGNRENEKIGDPFGEFLTHRDSAVRTHAEYPRLIL